MTSPIHHSGHWMIGSLCTLLALGMTAPSAPQARPAGAASADRLPSPVGGAAARAPLAALATLATEATPPASRHILLMEVTAYCPCAKCCGTRTGVTASGKSVRYHGGRFAAADTSVLPFGSKLIVPGYNAGRTIEVIDRGGAIRGNRLDVFFPTHAQARQWGRQWVEVEVVE